MAFRIVLLSNNGRNFFSKLCRLCARHCLVTQIKALGNKILQNTGHDTGRILDNTGHDTAIKTAGRGYLSGNIFFVG